MVSFHRITTNSPRSRFVPDKSRGQNFLIDKNVLGKIVAAAELKPTDTVIEIGAGTGILTVELAKRAGWVAAFEIDKKLIPILRENLKDFKNVEIVNEDILQRHCEERSDISRYRERSEAIPCEERSDISRYRERSEAIPFINEIASVPRCNIGVPRKVVKYKIIANIPYNITSAVLEKFLSAKNKPLLIVLLVQKEVAERVCASSRPPGRGKPGKMSVLSVMVQYYGRPEIIARVPASAFWPRPKVDSAILKIRLNIPLLRKEGQGEVDSFSTPPDLPFPRGGKEEKLFFQVVKAGFSRRRKMLKNNLVGANGRSPLRVEKILSSLGLSPTVRAQELGVEDWKKLTLAFLGQER